MEDGSRWREIARQIGPLATRLQDIEDGIEDFPQIDTPRTPAVFSGRNERFENGPFLIGQVAGVSFSAHPSTLAPITDFSNGFLVDTRELINAVTSRFSVRSMTLGVRGFLLLFAGYWQSFTFANFLLIGLFALVKRSNRYIIITLLTIIITSECWNF